MIRINLAPTKRARGADRGQQDLMVGILVLVLLAGAVLFLIDRPMRASIDSLRDNTERLQRENREKKDRLAGFEELKEIKALTDKRTELVTRLDNARATPAYMMRELSTLLESAGTPSMTRAMAVLIKDNPNRELSQEFDAKKVWITSFKEKRGDFTMKGGALSEADMVQLALRMQASVYFHDIVPEGGIEVLDKDSNISYYQFTIKGKVAY